MIESCVICRQNPSKVLQLLERQSRSTCRRETRRADLQSAANRPVWLPSHAAQQRTPELRCALAKQDATLLPQIHQVWQKNMQVYGADKL
jgi:hypothetical protein